MKKFWHRQLEVVVAEGIMLISEYYNDFVPTWVLWFTIAVVIVQFPIAYFYTKDKINVTRKENQ